MGGLLEGWSISGIVIVQSGGPVSLIDRSGGSVYGFAGPATVTLCPGATNKDLVTSGSTVSRLYNWINKSAICKTPAIGSDGSTGYGTTGQSIMNGPGQFNTDFSFGKTTTVGGFRENAQVAFRVELYKCPQSAAIFQSRHEFWDGKLRRRHPDFGGASADPVRLEVHLLIWGSGGPGHADSSPLLPYSYSVLLLHSVQQDAAVAQAARVGVTTT